MCIKIQFTHTHTHSLISPILQLNKKHFNFRGLGYEDETMEGELAGGGEVEIEGEGESSTVVDCVRLLEDLNSLSIGLREICNLCDDSMKFMTECPRICDECMSS